MSTATKLKGFPAAFFDGTSDELHVPVWASWGGWGGVTYDIWTQADADAVGTNRGILCEGARDAAEELNGVALFWRSDGTIRANVLTTGGSAAAVSATAQQDASIAHYVFCWGNRTPAEAPIIRKNGVELAPSSSTARAGTVATAPPGDLRLGYGPSKTGFQALRWKGRLGLSRLRSGKVVAPLLDTEYANQVDTTLFYGFGGWDGPNDANRAPIAVPAPSFTVPQNTPRIIDPRSNDIDRNGDTLSIVDGSLEQPAVGGTVALITTGADAGKIRFTPTNGFTGNAVFAYKVQDTGGKVSRGRVGVTVGGVEPAVTLMGFGQISGSIGDLATSLAATGSGQGQWGFTARATTIFAGQGGTTQTWDSFAADTGLPWSSGDSRIADAISKGLLPVICIPSRISSDTVDNTISSGATDTTPGPHDTALNSIIDAIRAKVGAHAWVARISHEANSASTNFPWYADRFTSETNLNVRHDHWKNDWRYLAHKIRNRVALTAGQSVRFDFCTSKGGVFGGTPTAVQIYPNHSSVQNPSGLNDATGLLYPTEDLVDVCGYDYYDAGTNAQGYAGQAGRTSATYEQWTGDSTVANRNPEGIYRVWKEFVSPRGKKIAIDEIGLKSLASGVGGSDNPKFVDFVHSLITDTTRELAGGDNLLWINWFHMNRNDTRPAYCHGIYPKTNYVGGPNAPSGDGHIATNGNTDAAATDYASRQFQHWWGEEPP